MPKEKKRIASGAGPSKRDAYIAARMVAVRKKYAGDDWMLKTMLVRFGEMWDEAAAKGKEPDPVAEPEPEPNVIDR